jgi:putative transposase
LYLLKTLDGVRGYAGQSFQDWGILKKREMPYCQIVYQIVYATKYRKHTLIKKDRKSLFQFIAVLIRNKGCIVHEIGGVSDHIHIVTHLHPSVALASLVKDVKLASTKFIKENNLFPDFNGWQDGYGAFTYSIDAKANLVAYVKNQEVHHGFVTSKEEFIKLLSDHEIVYDEKYLE